MSSKESTSPGALAAVRRFVDGPRGRLLKALIVAAVCALGTYGYGKFLHRAYPLGDWLAWPLLAIWSYALLFQLGCFGVGSLLLEKVFRRKDLPLLEAAVSSYCVGLLTFALCMYPLGALSLFRAWSAVALPIVFAAAGSRQLRAFWGRLTRALEAPREGRSTLGDGFVLALWIAGIVLVTFVYLQCMTPDAINYDASWCHITVGADYARHGKLVPFYGDYARAMPQLKSLADTWAFLVPGLPEPAHWMLCLHLEFCVFLWTLAAAAAAARWLLGDRPVRALWVVFFLFPAIFVYDSNLGGASDHYLALFAAPFFVASMRATEDFDARACALAGAMAGAGLNTKYQAVYFIFGIGLVLVGRFVVAMIRALRGAKTSDASPPSAKTILVGSAVLVATMLGVMLPHFAKNAAFYGNPVYPFLQDVISSSHPTFPKAAYWVEELFKDIRYRPQGTFGHKASEALKLTFTYAFKPHYSFTENYPNQGVLFTLTLPVVPFLKGARRVALGVVAGMGALFAWAMTYLVDRHLQVFTPLLVAVTAAVLVRAWELGLVARVAIVPLVLLQALWGGDAIAYSGYGRIKSSIDLIMSGYTKRASKRFDYRSDYRDLGAALPADAVILFHDRPNLGIDRDIVRDKIGEQGLFDFDGFGGPGEFYDYLKAQGVTHFVYGARQPLLSMQAEVLMTEVWTHYAQTTSRVHGFTIVELPKTAPPKRAPYRVATFGVTGYPDGLYDLTALNVVEVPGRAWMHYPKPSQAMPGDAKGQEDLAASADCVLAGSSRKPAFDLHGKTSVATFPAFSVYLPPR